MTGVPKKLQGLLWSVSTDKLDLAKDRVYIIHQVLMYGDFDDIRWLFSIYPKEVIKRVFLESPQKVYTKEAFNYIKRYVLDIDREDPGSERYVNAIH